MHVKTYVPKSRYFSFEHNILFYFLSVSKNTFLIDRFYVSVTFFEIYFLFSPI